MKRQEYSNHVKVYPPHHFVFYPVCIALIILAIYGWRSYPEQKLIWISLLAGFILVAWLSFMTRQHYAITLQNRLVKMELRFRYYVVTGRRFDDLERKLTIAQIAALRFAADDQLEALTESAVSENLPPKEIKQQIRTWVPDHMRV